jgi:hypothetical protein
LRKTLFPVLSCYITLSACVSIASPSATSTPNNLPSAPGTPNSDELAAVTSLQLTEFAAVFSATPGTYVTPLPLRSTPEGGWTTYTNRRYGFSFEYPSKYDTGSCGKLIVRESAQQLEIHVDGGTTFIKVTPANDIDLGAYAQQLIDKNGYPPMTTLDSFNIDGVPAVRFMLPLGLPTSAQYQKLALMIHQDKFYLFQYTFQNFVGCDAAPISEEAVYENLISTWHFLP